MQPTVLMMNIQGTRAEAIKALARETGIVPVEVPAADYAQTIGALCGLAERSQERHEGPGFEDELLVLAHFEKGLLNRFLDGFREKGIPPVLFKAMLTETNQQWKPPALAIEMRQEYEYFKRLQQEQQRREKA